MFKGEESLRLELLQDISEAVYKSYIFALSYVPYLNNF